MYSADSSPAKRRQPLSESKSDFSRYINPTGWPSTVILSLAKQSPQWRTRGLSCSSWSLKFLGKAAPHVIHDLGKGALLDQCNCDFCYRDRYRSASQFRARRSSGKSLTVADYHRAVMSHRHRCHGWMVTHRERFAAARKELILH